MEKKVRFKAFEKNNQRLELRLLGVVDRSKGGYQPPEAHGRRQRKAAVYVDDKRSYKSASIGIGDHLKA